MAGYTVGKQPCSDFKPRREANAYGEWNNVHCCIYCTQDEEDQTKGTVSYCENCHLDHHSGGYGVCERS